ncbi:hypothetical protein ACFL0C_00060 [Patescibacteria group bacterium]
MFDKTKNVLVLLFILLLGGLTLTTLPSDDPDFGWHYKYGEYITNSKSVLRENIYSHTLPNYHWSNSYWMSQTVMYLLFTNTGPLAASFLLSLLISSVVYFIFLREHGTLSKIMFGEVMFLLLASAIVSVRPFLFSTIFMIILVWILLYRRRLIFLIPIVFLFWANMHPDFLLGLFVLGIYTLCSCLSIITKKPTNIFSSNNTKKLARVLSLLLISIAATFINPYGYQLWVTLIKEMNGVTFGNIREVSPIKIYEDAGTVFTIYFLSAVILATSFIQKQKNTNWLFLCILFFFAMGSYAMYFYRIFFILGFFFLSKFIIETEKKVVKKISDSTLFHIKRGFKAFSPILISGVFVIIFGAFLENSEMTSRYSLKKKATSEEYPIEALKYIKKNKPKGNMFNTYEWGGYIIWNLPEYKTFIDGRMASWKLAENEYMLNIYNSMHHQPNRNVELVEHYFEFFDVNWVFVKKESGIAKYLTTKEKWTLDYEDNVTVIYSRNEKVN